MGIDLDALANELRAAGGNVRVSESMLCLELPYDLMAPLKTVVVVHDNGAVTLSMDEQGRPRSTVYVDQKLNAALAIIARHFGAGHPVAADRAALVERVDRALEWIVTDGEDRDRASDAALAAVEAAGWGPRAEPVAAGETLYRVCAECLGSGGLGFMSCSACVRGYVPVAPPEPLSAEELEVSGIRMFPAITDTPFRHGVIYITKDERAFLCEHNDEGSQTMWNVGGWADDEGGRLVWRREGA